MKKIYCPVLPYLLLLIALLPQASTANAQQTAFRHITVENGLSQNAVIAISQDSHGFMWMGTPNGLNRYDGYRIRQFQSRPADSTTLSTSSVLSILHDSRKQLWIGCFDGLNRYDERLDRFFRVKLPIQKSVAFYALYEDMQGRIWAGTDHGLFYVDPAQPQHLQPVLLPGQQQIDQQWNVRALLQDRKGRLWVGTTTGLLQMSQPGIVAGIMHYRHEPGNPASISADFVTTLAEDRYGKLWVGTHSHGLNAFDGNTGSFTRFLHTNTPSIISNTIRKVLIDKQGQLWIGTQEGLSILDETGRHLQSYQQNDMDPASLSHNSVHHLFQDKSDNIWIGTWFGGINYTYAVNTRFNILHKKDKPGHLNNNVISSITEDEKKNLWIGTEGGGLNYYDRNSGYFTSYRHNPNDPHSIGSNLIKVVYRDWQGQIWCGTHGGGLNLLDPIKRTFTRYLYEANNPLYLNAEIVGLYEDSRGHLWVGSTMGLKLYDKTPQGLVQAQTPLSQHPLFKQTAKYFLEDDKNRMWVSTYSGLYLIVNDSVRKVTDNITNCILQDKAGQVWLGLQQNGLARYEEKSRQLEYHNQPEKIGSRNIFGILEDNQQNLWLSSDNGLLKYHPRQNQLQLFTVSDGLAGNAFNFNSYFKDSKGDFYFGGFNGITWFSPDKIVVNPTAGNIVLTGLKLFNNPVQPLDSTGLLKESITSLRQLTLRHNQNVINLEFALINYIKSNKNNYAYKLKGYDKDWVYTTTPLASYVNLPSGDYDFLVKGANNDGVWSEPLTLSIEVLPPFWNTWWAWILYTLLAAGIIFLFSRYIFLRELFKKEDELHQVKLNFFTNVSHEIRTHLTLIMAPVEKMQDSEETGSFARQQLDSIRKNANRLLKLVSELMDFRKAETGHLKLQVAQNDYISFLEDIYNSFRDISIQKNISTSFIFDGQQLPLWFDKEQLEKVFFNLLTNAVRFTPANGNIILQVIETPTEAIVQVIDNGRGISAEHLDKVFTNFFQVDDHGLQNTGYGIGLALAKNIVSMHKGSITAESIPATGDQPGSTTFIVRLLKGYQHYGSQVVANDAGSPAPLVPTASNDPHAQLSRPATLQPATLLIVEDNIELRHIIREKFAAQFTILEATDGLAGWETAIAEIPDIIISDVMMPQMDGFELCRRLKTDPRTSHIPVILLTARSTQTDQVSGLETGANLYITKPFSTKVLELNVRNLLQARDSWQRLFQYRFDPAPPPMDPAVQEPIVNTVEQEFLKQVISIVEDNLDNQHFGVDMLSRKVAMSAPILYKKIKAVSNMSVNDFIKSIRLKKAAELLRGKDHNVFEVSQAVGYNDRKYFSREFKKIYGVTPSEYASGGA
ncbi:hybrid sensor histidine kinase/response regulator transcription factor [Paraflavitalea pollutisoli]|uniref:hybrid sensor histidine kinase/response regulator transcription factor n=1 Tax=Paraflavitalea pollutisoli TaxID=3034143 RepID=UPI0023EC5115|nr:hybrid sensor histidine kinase/response regulator transcription factor [Paraflavitalea sp. H1-2-19X]